MVLLHGLGEQGASWDEVRSAFDESFRVISIDLRGHGDSDYPGAYSIELMRDDVVGLLDELGLQRVTLVGHSMGALVAYLVAWENPSRIKRLVIEDAPPGFPRSRPVPERPDVPVPFDWAVVPAIIEQTNTPDPTWWDRLADITAPTLLIGGGPDSHIPQDTLTEAAARIPSASVVTIPAGHHVHVGEPDEFSAAVLQFLRASP